MKKLMTKMAVCALLAGVLIAGCRKSQKTDSVAQADKNISTFINSPDGLTGALKDNYVDFSFKYPQSWLMDPASSQDGASNFVRVERRMVDKGGKFTLENFAVGYLHGTGTASGDKALLPKLAKELEGKFSHDFSDYRLISDGPAKLGEYSGYGFRFESVIKDTPHGAITLWGRMMFIPNPKAGEKNGVSVMMLGSSLVPEIKSASDVGVKGQLPVILKSFKIGKTESNEQ
jgi:hypothetical protein